MNKQFILISLLVMGVILYIGFTSALEWDNQITYSEDDLKVTLTNSFLQLFPTSEIGTVTLRSHKSVDEVLEVSAGEQVVLYYDIEFNDLYENGLGEPEFINLKKGTKVDKKYKFVYWGFEEEEYDTYTTKLDKNGSVVYVKNGTSTRIVDKWLDYNYKDIQKGGIRIGIQVETKLGEKIDVIPTFAGKRLDKHAYYEVTSVTSAHGLTDDFGASQTAKMGIVWMMNGTLPAGAINLSITNVSKFSDSTSTKAYIQTNYTNTPLGTADFVGNTATFSTPVPITQNATYYILLDNNGGSRTWRGDLSITFPKINNGGTYITGVNQVGDNDTGAMIEVINITYQYLTELPFDVNITYPLNASVFQTENITINTSIEAEGSELTNASLYLYNQSLNSLNNDASLVGWWKLDGNATDGSTYGNNGTVSGAVITTGQYGGGYNFDGTNDLIDINKNVTDAGQDEFTASAWFYWTGEGGGSDGRNFIFETNGSGSAWAVSMNIQTSVLGRHLSANNPLNATSLVSSQVIQPNTWYHAVIVYEENTNYSLYINGVFENWQVTSGSLPATQGFKIGTFRDANNRWFNGTIDDVRVYNRSLTQTEIFTLYNQTKRIAPTTNISADNTTANYTLNYLVDADYKLLSWIGGYDSGDNFIQDWSDEVQFTIDANAPTIGSITPNGTQNYGRAGGTYNLNYTITDTNLNHCYLEYNGANNTIQCTSGMLNTTSFSLVPNVYSGIIYANDTTNKWSSKSFNWDYRVFQNTFTYNTTAYDTQSENFTGNFTANSSLTNVNFVYDGTPYQAVASPLNYTFSKEIDGVGNFSMYWSFTYDGEIFNSSTYYQQVNETVFTFCNATYDVPFLNVTFKDESTSSYINASIESSTFVYYLGNGTVNKTYTFSNTTVNDYYSFCGTPNQTIKVAPTIYYKQNSDYPQRGWIPVVQEYTNSLTEQILYLLRSTDGIYVTFQVINAAEQPLQGVTTNVTKDVGGVDVIVGAGVTGADGGITYWLNPDNFYTANFFLTGYPFYSIYQQFTQTGYTVSLTSDSSGTYYDYQKGITYSITPTNTYLENNTNYWFNFTISSSFWTLDSYGFNVTDQDGNLIGQAHDTTGIGGTVSYLVNTTTDTEIIMNPYWSINSTNSTIRKSWVVLDVSGNIFSIAYMASHLTSYIGLGLFGLDTQFGIGLLSFVIIVLVTGIIKNKWGISDTATTLGVIFGLTALLDISFGLIPSIYEIQHIPTIVMGILFIGMLWKELAT